MRLGARLSFIIFVMIMTDEKYKSEGFLGQKMFVLPPAIRKELEDHPIGNLLYITDIGYFPKALHHNRIREQGANEDILIFCIEGRGKVTIEDEIIEIGANEFCLLKKGLAHSYSADVNGPWSIYWVHFDGSKAEEICQNISTHNKISLRSSEEQGRIAMFNDFFHVLEAGITTERVLYLSMQLWALLSSFAFASLYSDNIQEQSRVEIAIKYLKLNLNKSLTLEDIAEKAQSSVSHFSSSFKQQTGYAPLNYFILLKMQEACRLLALSGMNIKEISFHLGYNDPYYFSRLFKKTIGVSPKAYRAKDK